MKKAHPAAEIFPMMQEGDLDALAEDVRRNGLRQPIVLDDEGRVLDGRNRLAACEKAGVEPEFMEANGSDPLDLVVSLNVKRRNLTAGQRAIAAAEAGVSKLTREARTKLAAMFETSDGYVQQARALVERDQTAAAAVKRGDVPLAEAYTQLREREGKVRGEGKRRAQLAAEAPDLAEQVEAGTVSLADALAEAKARRDREKQSRWAATMNVLDGLQHFDREADRDQVETLASQVDPDAAAGRGEKITPERLRRAAQFATALAEAIESKEE